MKFRQLESFWHFMLMLFVFVAGNALYKLHSVGQQLLGVVSESIFAAAGVSLLKYIWKRVDKEIRIPRLK